MSAIITTKYPKKPVETWLNEMDYEFVGYMPTDMALLFVNFIKEVNNGQEENETPIVHLLMLDGVFNGERRCAIMCHRGIGKTTLFGEYLILFIASFGYLPGFGKVNLLLYVTDSIENGVKNLRRNVEFRYQESEFLQKLIPNKKLGVGENGTGFVSADKFEEQAAGGRKFTDIRLEFVNHKGHTTIVKGFGAKTGVRGTKELGQRPVLAILDDLVSDTDAESDTVINTIENTIYKAVSKALHPTKQKIIWLGTPFNARDPLYKAVESGAWKVSVYPVCEKYPCTEAEFRGSWPDRFPFSYVKEEYDEAQALGKPENFDQELMLRIMSAEDRIVTDAEIQWYKRANLLQHRNRFNFYITSDFATKAEQKNDFSVILVWAINNIGHWFLVDGMCRKQLMNKNIDDLFYYAQKYLPQSVGIEVSGQQGGFVTWIQDQMMDRNVWFTFASDSTEPGIKPNTNKMVRFNVVLPWFKAKKMFFPQELATTPLMLEMINELTLACKGGFKSKHDDCLDAISMLGSMQVWRPSEELNMHQNSSGLWELEEDADEIISVLDHSYIV